jgi:hypothetical protein
MKNNGIQAHFFSPESRTIPVKKNRAFRSKSSEALMRFLWAFRCNPLARPAPCAGEEFNH